MTTFIILLFDRIPIFSPVLIENFQFFIEKSFQISSETLHVNFVDALTKPSKNSGSAILESDINMQVRHTHKKYLKNHFSPSTKFLQGSLAIRWLHAASQPV